jgi:hypothetical protein
LGVCATENAGKWILTRGQRFALVLEVVPLGNAADVAKIAVLQGLKCSIG